MHIGKYKALVVDDEEHIRDLLSLVLESLGFEVSGKASNGQEALDLYQSINPDIMILDINMPVMSGEEVLLGINNYQKTCIIMLTAVSDIDTVKKCIALGISHFIRKDTPMPKMIETIRVAWSDFIKKNQVKNT